MNKIILVTLTFLTLTTSLIAEQNNKGLSIALEADKRASGFRCFTSQLKMILKNKSGEIAERILEVKTIETENDGDKSIAIFKSPKDVDGTALLQHTHISENDDRWLYLPALRRVKRIENKSKSGPFMGSEFSYEDLSSQEVKKYTYKFLKEDQLNGLSCYVVERIPIDQYSGYSYQEVWYDKEEYRIQRINFFDRKGAFLKQLAFNQYKKYLGFFWRASVFEMKNVQNGKNTIIYWNNYNFDKKLTQKDFTVQALKRII